MKNEYKMKTIRIFSIVAGLVMGAAAFMSCEREGIEPTPEDNTAPVLNKASMRLVGDMPSYESATKADGTEGEWADKSKVYLQFAVGDKMVSGSATYDLMEDIWALEYAGTLNTVESALCHAYYFENAGEATFEEVPMTEKTAVYIDTTATYSFSFEDNLIVLKAHLKPYLSRVRLEGKHKQGYNFDGPLHYTSYNMLENKFVSSTKMICDTIPESGKTDYYYLFFKDQSKKQMFFYDYVTGDKFTRTFPENVFAMGKSGYLNAPTAEAYSGWEAEKLYIDVKVYNETVRMIRVEPGTFMMGMVTSTETDAMPVHQVTLTKPYYISETEVTNAVWYAVQGSTPSKYTGSSRPVQDVSWNDCSTFITNLNNHTGKKFSLPTEAQWEFAARGGNMSKGYKYYSGSNAYKDVAVFGRSGQSGTYLYSSYDYGPLDVKTKKPNELGIYDMSGNVLEWCSDWYGAYSSSAQTNPSGPASNSSDYKVIRGGSWWDGSLYMTTRTKYVYTLYYYSYSSYTYYYGMQGLRLVMEP